MKAPLLVRKITCRLQGIRWLSDEGIHFQKSTNDCGEACIYMVMQAFHVKDSLPASATRFRPRGLSLSEMAAVLKNVELSAEGMGYTSYTQLCHNKKVLDDTVILPVMRGFEIPRIYSGTKHIIVLDSADNEGVIVKDPVFGQVNIPRKKFEKKWTTYCLHVTGDNRKEVTIDAFCNDTI